MCLAGGRTTNAGSKASRPASSAWRLRSSRTIFTATARPVAISTASCTVDSADSYSGRPLRSRSAPA